MTIREMQESDYGEVSAMWQVTSKRALSKSDGREEICRYLKRNEGLSVVAEEDGKIIGAVLVGHDGRRGFLHHMAVLPQYRRHGVARRMAQAALEGLNREGIDKTHIFVFSDNQAGQAFWSSMGFLRREDVLVYSCEHGSI